MLKQGIPDPATLTQRILADSSGDKENNDSALDAQLEHFADAVFVHTKFVPPLYLR